MDFDECDDSVLPQTVAGLFEGKDGLHDSSWNFQNSDNSRFSFANEQGHANQELEFSVLQDSRENRDSIYKPQYQASKAQNVTPPGVSNPSPGFPSSMRTEQVVSASSGSYTMNSLSNNQYGMPSIGNHRNNSDDLTDPAIMVVERGKSLSFDMQSSSFNEETTLPLDATTICICHTASS